MEALSLLRVRSAGIVVSEDQLQLISAKPSTLVRPKAFSSLPAERSGSEFPHPESRWLFIDFLRAAAALLVFGEHFAGMSLHLTHDNSEIAAWQYFLLHIGTLGSDALLLLSGFFDAKSMAGASFRYGNFVKNRALRILPVYFFVLLMAIGFGTVFPSFAKVQFDHNFLSILISNLILLPKFFSSQPILTVSWMLAYICMGYVTLPVLSMLVQRRIAGKKGRMAAWGAAIVLSLAGTFTIGFPALRFVLIPLGCLAFELDLPSRLAKSRWAFRSAVVGAVGLLVVRFELDCGNWQLLGSPAVSIATLHVASAVAIALILALLLTIERESILPRWMEGMQFVARFGQRGYSFYLLHGAAIKLTLLGLTHYLTPAWDDFPTFLAAMVLCLVAANTCAHLCYALVEKPVQRIRQAPALRRENLAPAV